MVVSWGRGGVGFIFVTFIIIIRKFESFYLQKWKYVILMVDYMDQEIMLSSLTIWILFFFFFRKRALYQVRPPVPVQVGLLKVWPRRNLGPKDLLGRDAHGKPVFEIPDFWLRPGSRHTRFYKTWFSSSHTRFRQPVLQFSVYRVFYRVNTRVYPSGIYPVLTRFSYTIYIWKNLPSLSVELAVCYRFLTKNYHFTPINII